MCGPWVLPLALVAAGSIGQYFGNKKAENAQARAFFTERERQKSFTEDQQGLFDDSLKRTGELQDPEAQQRATSARDTFLRALLPSAESASYLPGSSSAPSVVHTAADSASSAQRAESGGLAAAMARLSGLNDQIFDTNIMSNRNAGRIGQIGSFKMGSASALDPEMRAAAHKGSFLRGAGQLAQQIGMAMLSGGAGRGGMPSGGADFGGGFTLPGMPYKIGGIPATGDLSALARAGLRLPGAGGGF